MKRTLLLLFFAIGLGYLGWGQILTFDFVGLAGNEATATSNTNNANLTTSTISRGAGLTAGTNTDRYNATSWAITSIANAVTGNDYMEFSITPNSGYQFSVSSIVVNWQRSATGNTAISLRSSVDAYATDLDAIKTVVDNTTTQVFTWTFTQANSTTAVTYRFYSYAESVSGTGGPGDGTGNDIIVNGSVTASGNVIPTVTTQAVTAIATTTATGNGNITATGGVDPTERGFCWDLAANADPDITDTKVFETGTYTIGAFTGSITGLTPGAQYKVRAYATNTQGTGYGSVVTFYALSTEPSNHPGSFTATTISQTQIDLAFSAASTIPNAAGYLILQKTTSSPTGAPVDATGYAVGNTIGDGTVAAIITSTSATSSSITGLTAGTNYHFTIFPYNWDGANASTYNYKTDPTVPTASATTTTALDATSEVSGPALVSQPNPVLLSSLVTTAGAAIRVFDMDVYDYATADAQPTKITQVTIKAGTNNTTNWATTIAGVKLSTDAGGTFATIGVPTITASSIVIPITSGNLNIPNGTPLTLSMYVYLNVTGIIDNQILEFKVDQTADSHGFVADATGSTFISTFATAPVSNQISIDVVATKLQYVQQPTSTSPNQAMSPAVIVEAADANNNRDLSYATPITITSTGTLTGSPVTGILASGLATFSTLTHTAPGTGLTLTTSSGALNVVSNSFNIQSLLLEENFSYTIGQDLSANGWNITSAASPTVAVSTPTISYTGYASSGVGNEVSMATSGQDVNKTFAATTAGTIYVSCIINVTSATLTGDYFFHLGASPMATFHGRFFVKKDGSNNLAFGISKVGAIGTAIFTPFNYALNTTYLIIFKYSIVAGASNDVAEFFINTTLNTTEPLSGWITSTDVAVDLSNIGSVGLRQGGSTTAPALKIDGIRVATSWADIVGTEQVFTGTGNWTDVARWNSGAVPATASAATIDGNATVSTAASITELKINNTRSLTIANTGQLTVNRTLTNNAGTTGLVIKSDNTGTGSLINNTAGVSATIERYITGEPASGASTKYHLVSHPFTADYTAGAWSGSYLYNYNEPTGEYVPNGSSESTTMFATKGYMIYYPGASKLYSHTGTLHTGTSTIPATYTAGTYAGLNLVANMYPSPLDFDVAAAWGGAAAISTKIWIWSSTAGNYGSHIRSGANTNNVTNIIPVGQGFFVEATATGDLTIANTAQAHNNTQLYLKNGADLQNSLSMKVSGNNFSDEIIVQFREDATTGYDDQIEAKKLTGQNEAPQLSSVITDNMKLSINSLPFSATTTIVPLNFSLNAESEVSFNVSNLESFDQSSTIFLEDKLLNQMIDLRETPTCTFTHSTGNDALRFNLHFYGVNTTGELAVKDYNIWSTVDHINIHIPALTGQKALVVLYDLLGHQLLSQQLNLGSPTTIAVPQFNGMGIVKVISGGNVYSEKVFIQ
jgi:hypothetical protein